MDQNMSRAVPHTVSASLLSLGRHFGLRADYAFNHFTRESLPRAITGLAYPTVPFYMYIASIRNGKDVSKTSYSFKETEFIYLTVNNIRKHEITFDEVIFLDESTGKTLLPLALAEGDLVFTRSGTIGVCHLFDLADDKVYIPSGYTIVVRAKNISPRFLELYMNSSFIQSFLEVLGTGKTQKNLAQGDLKRVPVPDVPTPLQERILERVTKGPATSIKTLETKLVSLQGIIDKAFISTRMKQRGGSRVAFETLNTTFSKLSGQIHLRCGAQYRAFYENHRGLLFDDPEPKYPIRRLGELMRPYPASVLRKGMLDEEYILIELENIESLTGRIITEDNVVTEIGSDKVVFGDCDLLVGKLRPYLGYAVLNDKDKPYIGTTELLPFSVNRDLARPEYLRYLLLSRDFLHISSMLMYGKEHPRIHPRDLLAIRVPRPPLEVQKGIIDEIHEKEQKNQKKRVRIGELRQDIDRILWQSLLSEKQ